MSALIKLDLEMTTMTCQCGGTYAITERYREIQQQKGGSWHCPYCATGWGYSGRGENDKLKRELAAEKERKERALAEANTLRHNLTLEKGKVTRLKKRVANGVCPCCTRSFVNLQRHISSKHPEFTP